MSIAYKILKKLNSDKAKPKEEILKMADVYYAAGRISEEEYGDIISLISTSSNDFSEV